MAQNKKMAGLLKRNGLWHIDKWINGRRICESTGASEIQEAEKYLIRKLELLRQAEIYGVRPKRIFREAAIKYLLENQHKRSSRADALHLKRLDSFIGELFLEAVHMGSLQTFIEARQLAGVKNRTINYGLQVTRRILNLAASEWMDEYGMTWLISAPKIKLLSERDARKPYPLSWEEQEKLLSVLPEHLRNMILFAVNTGCRDREVCQLKWNWEVKLEDREIPSVFVIPGDHVKNGHDRLVVLNRIAKAIIEKQRGKHDEFVFVYKNKPIDRMLNSAWKNGRKKADLAHVRIHDLKHTYGTRLRSAGVSFEDRQDLLGHKSARITTHYSAAELINLWQASNRACDKGSQTSILLSRTIALNANRIKLGASIV